ncbi:MAG: ABC transporter ATP-binding protein [Planctomycetota bacterium]|nr:ABC transporter ATP-binding protein [Planctomycetota bacterium]
MVVKVVQLKRHFGPTRAVDGISFEFAAGHIFGFVGPNGAGKTTTMRILATLDEPTAGDAFVQGVSVVQEPEQVRHLVGFMPDSLPVHRDISVHEYLDFFARAYGIRGRKRKQVVEGVEDFTNLMGIRDKMLRALSKGMKQRVSLARAIVHDPAVLVLDEPAAGLDPRARVELRELLRALADRGKAILISSHILTELSEICDGAVLIERGKLLRAGRLDEILVTDGRRIVLVRPLGPVEPLCQALLEMPRVTAARPSGGQIEVHVDGDDEHCADLLGAILQRGFRVADFHQQRNNLEQVFMSVTKGEVQ